MFSMSEVIILNYRRRQ